MVHSQARKQDTNSMSTSYRDNIDRLLDTEMDRMEFLKICGVGILAAVGVSGVLKALAGAQPKKPTTTTPAQAPGAYGGHPFGG